MYFKSLVTLLIFTLITFNGLSCNAESNNKTKIDLQTFLDDLTVAAHSMQYTVSLNSRLLEELKKRVQKNEVSCEFPSVVKNDEIVDDFLSSQNSRVIFFHIRDRTYGLLRTPQTWNEARKSCTNLGGRLVDVKNEAQAETLAQNFERIKVNDSESVYVGVHSLFDKNDWVSIAGDPVSETLNWKLMSNGTDATSEANKNCGVLSGETIDKVDCDDKHMAICLM